MDGHISDKKQMLNKMEIRSCTREFEKVTYQYQNWVGQETNSYQITAIKADGSNSNPSKFCGYIRIICSIARRS